MSKLTQKLQEAAEEAEKEASRRKGTVKASRLLYWAGILKTLARTYHAETD